MGYDRGDSFPFDFEPNRIPFGSKLKGKLSLRSYPIHCERKWKYSFLSAATMLLYLSRDPFLIPTPVEIRGPVLWSPQVTYILYANFMYAYFICILLEIQGTP